MRVWLVLGLLVGCDGGETYDDEPPDQPGVCGEPTFGIEMTFLGRATAGGGATTEGIEVALTDGQVSPPKVLGTATTGPDGRFTLDATDISSWPDCWLTLLDYRLVGTFGEYEGELEVNRYMWEAIQAETYEVDLLDKPLVLQ